MFRAVSLWMLDEYGSVMEGKDGPSMRLEWQNRFKGERYGLSSPLSELKSFDSIPSVILFTESKLPNGQTTMLLHRLGANENRKTTEFLSYPARNNIYDQPLLQSGPHALFDLEGLAAQLYELDQLMDIVQKGIEILADNQDRRAA